MSADVLTLNCEAFAAVLRGDKAEAEKKYRAVLELDPGNTDALRLLGNILGSRGNAAESAPMLAAALEKDVSLWSTWSDLGQALQISAQTPEQMIEGVAHTLCACMIAEEQLVAETGEPVAFHPGYSNVSLGLIALGDWQRGWRLYEHGFFCGKRHLRTRAGKLWKGERIGHQQRLFVHWEGGMGDTLCWMRLLPLLRERTKCIILLEVQRPLLGLLQNSDGAHNVCEHITQPDLDDMDAIPAFDYRVSIQSLINRLGLGLEDIPAAPYIRPYVAPWPIRGRQAKVGICWRGNKLHENDANRSTTEAVFMEALRGLDFIHYYSLAFDDPAQEAIPLAIQTFTDTAAMIAAMDVVVTVDTAVAHLAGAMGKEVWILLPYIGTDYRWGLGSDRTPLYPTAKLYRQTAAGDWHSVLRRVRRDLSERFGFRSPLEKRSDTVTA